MRLAFCSSLLLSITPLNSAASTFNFNSNSSSSSSLSLSHGLEEIAWPKECWRRLKEREKKWEAVRIDNLSHKLLKTSIRNACSRKPFNPNPLKRQSQGSLAFKKSEFAGNVSSIFPKIIFESIYNLNMNLHVSPPKKGFRFRFSFFPYISVCLVCWKRTLRSSLDEIGASTSSWFEKIRCQPQPQCFVCPLREP